MQAQSVQGQKGLTMKRNVVAIDKSRTQSNWETPPAVFKKLNEDFGPFDIDLTANDRNHLCKLWWGPDNSQTEDMDIMYGGTTDALTAPWSDFGMRGYSNPPYGHPFVSLLLAKAVQEATRGFSTTLLLPLRITQAFRQYILHDGHAQGVWVCDKRICFYEDGHPRWNQARLEKNGVKHADPAMFDSMIVRFGPDAQRTSLLGQDMQLARIGVMLFAWHVPPHV